MKEVLAKTIAGLYHSKHPHKLFYKETILRIINNYQSN